MRQRILGKYTKLSSVMIFWGCLFATMSHAESGIKLWKSQTVYVPIYSSIFERGDVRVSLNLSANVIVRNTDSANSIQITDVIYYNSEGKLIKSYLNSPKILKPMASTYFLIEEKDHKGGWGANFIIKWESTSKVTQPLIEAIHSGQRGTGIYSYAIRGWAIKGIHE
jgi:hypothetical protein